MANGPKVVIVGAGLVGCGLADELAERGGDGQEPVFVDGAPAGYVTSAAFGFSVGAIIAYAWLPRAAAVPGRPVEIDYFGVRVPAPGRRRAAVRPRDVEAQAMTAADPRTATILDAIGDTPLIRVDDINDYYLTP